jgi:hypothetical protein
MVHDGTARAIFQKIGGVYCLYKELSGVWVSRLDTPERLAIWKILVVPLTDEEKALYL